MLDNTKFHQPVLLNEVLDVLQPQDHKTYLDCTFGAGGYSLAILKSAKCKVVACDRDASVSVFADNVKQHFGDNFCFINIAFSQIKQALAELNIAKVDGMVLDIGVSSMQLNYHTRGFSFDSQAKLDMRMNQNQALCAYDVVNNYTQKQLAEIIANFGDEPKAYAIAKKIAFSRMQKPIESCIDLANLVRSFYAKHYKTDPATKTFQAIRIEVNKELEELTIVLNSALQILQPKAKLVVVSFHSLEDKIIKDFFNQHSGKKTTISRYQPQKNFSEVHEFIVPKKLPIVPTEIELSANHRSRSAKLRWGEKI
jgi:16S rRNA (cytosine1402-N4)-methyltransferase